MRLKSRHGLWTLLALLLAISGWLFWPPGPPDGWDDGELALLRSLSIDSWTMPASPGNRVADDPRAIELGRRLFFDPRLSDTGEVSCSLCHQPRFAFSDGLDLGQAIGASGRNTRALPGAAGSPWLYWDGRRDSLWAQALSPLEDPAEHGGNRMAYVRFVASEPAYRAAYEDLFGALPELMDQERFPRDAGPVANPSWAAAWARMAAADQQAVNLVFANLGKAIAAFERQLLPQRASFDQFVTALASGSSREVPDFGASEQRGLKLFIGKGRCLECHNGPLFTNNEFHNTGVLPYPGALPDRGRIEGLRLANNDLFNCRGPFNDAPEQGCPELDFARDDATLLGAFRTPGLRDVGLTAPYMHKGQLKTLADVIGHYNEAPEAVIGHNEAKPLGLSWRERRDLEAFLRALTGPPTALMPAATALAASQESTERQESQAVRGDRNP